MVVDRIVDVEEDDVQVAVGKMRPLDSTAKWPEESIAMIAQAEGVFSAFLRMTWAIVSLSDAVLLETAALLATL